MPQQAANTLAKADHVCCPIRDYALIGDCHGSALVSRHGSVDWCCLGRFDADPVFCRLLDAVKGGFFSIAPSQAFQATRAYVPETNILRTIFSTPTGKLEVTDFMPVGRKPGSGVHDYVTLTCPFWLVRIVKCLEGVVSVDVRYRPTIEFARRPARLQNRPGVVVAEAGPTLFADIPLSVSGDLAAGNAELRAGQEQVFVVTPDSSIGSPTTEQVFRLLEITRAFWLEWSSYCRYRGPYRDAVLRSALVLKLLTYAPTGAIVAAPTTSLPEEIGGERNWDYRYCWLRDAAFTLYALAALGYSGEARRFSEFLRYCCTLTLPRLQIMYGIDGQTDLTERTLEHLEGYAGSRPVRVGNAAFTQQQLDVYGEVLDWAYLYRTLGGRVDAEGRRFLRALVEFIAERVEVRRRLNCSASAGLATHCGLRAPSR